MYIDEYKFGIEKEVDGPLVLKPIGDFDILDFIKKKREAIFKFCAVEPFFVIRGVEMNEGRPIGTKSDLVNTDWHYDEGEIIVLANNFEGNNRGKTEWVSNEVLFGAFLSQASIMRNFDESFFTSEGQMEMFHVLLEKCIAGNRESISRMLGVLYIAPNKPYEVLHVLRHIEQKVGRYIFTCNWIDHSKSALFINNASGFHRGVYNQGQGQPLKRQVL